LKEKKILKDKTSWSKKKNNKANQRWKIIYKADAEKEQTSGIDKDTGFKINKPFYIKSRMPLGRVAEAIGANNVTLKTKRVNVKGQQFFYDGVSKTVKSN